MPEDQSKIHFTENTFIAKETKKLTEALSVRHYSEHTKQTYKKWVADFLRIYQAKADSMGGVVLSVSA